MGSEVMKESSMMRQLVTMNSVSIGYRGVVCRINTIAMLTQKAAAVR